MIVRLRRLGWQFRSLMIHRRRHWHSEHGFWGWFHVVFWHLWTNFLGIVKTNFIFHLYQLKLWLCLLESWWQQLFQPKLSSYPSLIGLSLWILALLPWKNMFSLPFLPIVDLAVFMLLILSLLLRHSTIEISILLQLWCFLWLLRSAKFPFLSFL